MRFRGLDGNGLDREFQDEPTGQRLHRRDTPHHLKNKRIHQQVNDDIFIVVSIFKIFKLAYKK